MSNYCVIMAIFVKVTTTLVQAPVPVPVPAPVQAPAPVPVQVRVPVPVQVHVPVPVQVPVPVHAPVPVPVHAPVALCHHKRKKVATQRSISLGFSSSALESMTPQNVTSLPHNVQLRALSLCRSPVTFTFSKGFLSFYYVPQSLSSSRIKVCLVFFGRALTVDERNETLQQIWKQLEERSGMLQHKQSRTAAT